MKKINWNEGLSSFIEPISAKFIRPWTDKYKRYTDEMNFLDYMEHLSILALTFIIGSLLLGWIFYLISPVLLLLSAGGIYIGIKINMMMKCPNCGTSLDTREGVSKHQFCRNCGFSLYDYDRHHNAVKTSETSKVDVAITHTGRLDEEPSLKVQDTTTITRPKAILFDMGDTLIKYNSFDVDRGNEALMDHCLNYDLNTLESVNEAARILSDELNKVRDLNHIEYASMNFQRQLYNTLGLEFDIDWQEMEELFNEVSFDREAMGDVHKILAFLELKGIRTAVLSNTSFNEATISKEMQELGILDFMEFVVATADYIYRKPSAKIFEVCLKKLGLQAEDVWYVGNSYEYDVIGANNASMQAIWFNWQDNEPQGNHDYKEIRSLNEIIELVEAIETVEKSDVLYENLL